MRLNSRAVRLIARSLPDKGWHPSAPIRAEADARGIGPESLKRAMDALGVRGREE